MTTEKQENPKSVDDFHIKDRTIISQRNHTLHSEKPCSQSAEIKKWQRNTKKPNSLRWYTWNAWNRWYRNFGSWEFSKNDNLETLLTEKTDRRNQPRKKFPVFNWLSKCCWLKFVGDSVVVPGVQMHVKEVLYFDTLHCTKMIAESLDGLAVWKANDRERQNFYKHGLNGLR